MIKIVCQPYQSRDHAACLAIFDSNVPRFFDPAERDEFRSYLAETDLTYLVLIGAGVVVACGGLVIDPARHYARLTWGMVDNTLHHQGLGKQLTLARVAHARTLPHIKAVSLSTSQHTKGFYQRMGFDVSKVTTDGLGVGLDCWDMRLNLTRG